MTRRIEVVDSHTAGEPTRLVVAGGPDLGPGSVADQAARLAAHHDDFRSLVVREPRGSDVLVGALLCPAQQPDCATGVIFFNNVGLLGMCGHGLMGVVATLAYRRQLATGRHRFETPVGVVAAELHPDGRVSVHNVRSYRFLAGAEVQTAAHGRVRGDIAWGGNWFFLTGDLDLPLELSRVDELTAATWDIRQSLTRNGITGAEGAEIDHIELIGPARTAVNHARNFVLCPGKAYDRSPCGTGTSAKLACLAAAGTLAPGAIWRQESVLGTVFEGVYAPAEAGIWPTITGAAYVTAESTLLLDPRDPFPAGILG
ncbi:MAG TPA: proline racemase family protein [Gemmatales bacterium]|nr:proline racemase family protein [Gemmatales bacterium]